MAWTLLDDVCARAELATEQQYKEDRARIAHVRDILDAERVDSALVVQAIRVAVDPELDPFFQWPQVGSSDTASANPR